MKTAFIICSRLSSSRLPKKALMKINGIPLLVHLIRRLNFTQIPVILAVPDNEVSEYQATLSEYGVNPNYFCGNESDPLARMLGAAEFYEVENAIRVSHDKIFVDPTDVFEMINSHFERGLDYSYSSMLIPGTGFEIISRSALKSASDKYKEVEFIGYAVKSLTSNFMDHLLTPSRSGIRLLIDYKEDVSLMELLFSSLGNDCSLDEVLQYLDKNRWALGINRLPQLTIYTCVYNGADYIDRCMSSVSSQNGFKHFEYVLVDDHSSDSTTERVAKFCATYPNASWHRNAENRGLAYSSNAALKMARGKYIMRIDADDYFASWDSAQDILSTIEQTGKDAVVPNFYVDNSTDVGLGRDNTHIGGTIFRTSALNHMRFNDKLRGYEGLDLFVRAKDQLRLGYFNKPMFIYSQRHDSMSRTNLSEREKIKAQIMSNPDAGACT